MDEDLETLFQGNKFSLIVGSLRQCSAEDMKDFPFVIFKNPTEPSWSRVTLGGPVKV